jgi:hypothetical protein
MDRREDTIQGLREQIIHGLRMQGWSRIDAENEADERLSRPPNTSIGERDDG